MKEPLFPTPVPGSQPHDPLAAGSSGEGAQSALAALIRQRKMGENRVDNDPVPPPDPVA